MDRRRELKVLVTGWFSFERGEATAGDLLARDVACEWLERAGRSYDVALSPVFEGGVEWSSVDPGDYSDVVFVCGPARGEQVEELARRFSGCRLVGLDVSVTGGMESVPDFDLLLERDSPRTVRPDISFAARTEAMPVVGLVLAHPQPEYGDRAMHEEVHEVIRRVVYGRRFSVIPFNTRVDPTSEEFRTPDEVETLVARMDLIVTTRMHGLVHALKSGVPAVAVDPISGGGKVQNQAEAAGWPAALTADELSEEALHRAFDFCLSPEARGAARDCAGRVDTLLREVRDRFVAALREDRRAYRS
jgi:hypothetical protein